MNYILIAGRNADFNKWNKPAKAGRQHHDPLFFKCSSNQTPKLNAVKHKPYFRTVQK